MKTYKADLHVHSSYSNKPTYWAMRKFNCPESYTSPRQLYQTALARGMDYVTITDHNAIGGALEIAHLPRTFISAEITTHFPENDCKAHVVVLHISEAQFGEIMRLRKNIYDLVVFLNQQGIAHFLAHPLYAQNDKLTLEIIEKSLLLFSVFEIRNGCRASRFNNFTATLVGTLTQTLIERLADKHNLTPLGDEPYRKGVVGGSDDHGGLFIARAHTCSRRGEDLDAFLDAVREGGTWAEGEHGGPLTMAHSLYGVAHNFYRERFGERRRSATPFVSALLDRFFNLGTDKGSFVEKIRLFVLKNLPEKRSSRELSFEELLDSEARQLLNDTLFLEGIKGADLNRKIFMVTSRLANRILYQYTNRFMSLSMQAGFFDYLNTAGTIGLVHLLISPYYLAFHHQHKGKELIREIAEQLPEIPFPPAEEKIALFTDTLDEINGVAMTIRRLIKTAQERGISLTVITSGDGSQAVPAGVKQFQAVGDFVLPEYPELKLSFPPILDVLNYIEKEGITRIHVSTPGTVGLLGLLIARLMNIPVAGTYHTDIPQYVRSLTNDEFLEQAAWSYMIWFYNQMEEVLVPSAGTREQLLSHGLPLEKMKPLPRWVDTDQFRPDKRVEQYWKQRGLADGTVLLYVGRVSKEKALDLLVEAFCRLFDEGAEIALAIIGDGPYREEMEAALVGYPVLFTGYLQGEELQRAYASADLFVFPSATDTFGNVVLEAQASGLPVIVSDAGGPRELMVAGETGLVFSAGNLDALVAAIRQLIANRLVLSLMGDSARAFSVEKAPHSSDTYSTILQPGLRLDAGYSISGENPCPQPCSC
ncbi:Glycosyltransferase involved in cell wall bisynthesis [Trichlorobacter thiogenes]|uniref:Glycosyltransferase involved in cell wall bisynthesis n=1 Tax=Trichlorobacter thiogenes TaxID=115783 RepID=A0A1T4ME97_9BACT|nr:glycosyltransferase [Trichlorobacter thiogenes]SJZ65243.1 Glycosyltransferase involved in cell wall bisynthesis [Trichlorobacter thiogenes]